MGNRVSGNSDAVILDVQTDDPGPLFRPDADVRTARGIDEFHRIRQQLRQGLAQGGEIADDLMERAHNLDRGRRPDLRMLCQERPQSGVEVQRRGFILRSPDAL